MNEGKKNNHFETLYSDIFKDLDINLNVIYRTIYSKRNTYLISVELECIYEEVLSSLSLALNSIHKNDYPISYWRIIIGPWLLHYIHFCYDKILIHGEVKRPLKSELVIENQYMVPRDTYSFFEMISTDKYNKQGLVNTFFIENNKISKGKIIDFTVYDNFKRRILKRIYKKTQTFINSFGELGDSLIIESYFSKKIEKKLFLKSKGKLQNFYFEKKKYNRDLDWGLRINQKLDLTEINFKGIISEKENCRKLKDVLERHLFLDIPAIFLENFNEAKTYTMNDFPDNPKLVFSATATHHTDLVKIWLAEKKLYNNSKIIGMQHGGVYGSTLYSWYENHEIKINDYFFTWGWKKKDDKKVIDMFPQKIIGEELDWNPTEKILMVTTSQPKYLFRYPYTPYDHENYIYELEKFLVTFPENLSKNLVLRLYRKDQWEINNYLRDELKHYKVDTNTNFYESLREAKIFICDHPSTTFLEALFFNVPTILFWDMEVHLLREEALPFYNELKKAEILFDQNIDAIQKIKDIYECTEEWWFSEEVQKARKEFCDEFCKNSSDYINDFAEYF